MQKNKLITQRHLAKSLLLQQKYDQAFTVITDTLSTFTPETTPISLHKQLQSMAILGFTGALLAEDEKAQKQFSAHLERHCTVVELDKIRQKAVEKIQNTERPMDIYSILLKPQPTHSK